MRRLTIPLTVESDRTPSRSTSAPTAIETQSRLSGLVVVDTVASTEQLGPWSLGPLPPDRTPLLSIDDVLAILQRGATAKYFETEADFANARISVGLITDASDSAAPDSGFAGYLEEGGSSPCLPSCPPEAGSSPLSEISCHISLIINDSDQQQRRSPRVMARIGRDALATFDARCCCCSASDGRAIGANASMALTQGTAERRRRARSHVDPRDTTTELLARLSVRTR